MEDGIKLSEQLRKLGGFIDKARLTRKADWPWVRDIDNLKSPHGWSNVNFHCFEPILSVCNASNVVR